MSHAIRLELRNYRLTREKSLRDLLDRLATDAPDPRALVARLLAALVAADDNAKPFIESIVPVAGLGARVG
jgi:hypothetical protein